MDPDCFIRVTNMLQAIKIFIEVANKLTDRDIKYLEQVVDCMKGGNKYRGSSG